MGKNITTINLVFVSLSIIMLSVSANNVVFNALAIALLFTAIFGSIVLSLWYKNNEHRTSKEIKDLTSVQHKTESMRQDLNSHKKE